MTQSAVATLTGPVDLALLDTRSITVKAIAHGLCLPRWLNATELPIFVNHHSILVANQLPPALRIYGLLHDAHEYVLGDLISPVERELSRRVAGFKAAWANLKAETDIAIRQALGVPEPTLDMRAAVHAMDLRIAATEWISLMPEVNGPCPVDAKPIATLRIKPLTRFDAADQFRQCLEVELHLRSWSEVAA